MRPQAIATLIKQVANSTRRTICIEGAPGGGKTSVVKQAAKEVGIPCVVKHLPTMLVEDFGILFPKDDNLTMSYRLPDWFPVAGEAPEKGILCFDDSNQAGPDLQKVIANICQERELHGHKLPDGWMVVRTGNRQSDRAGAGRILSHLRDRENVINFETHLEDFLVWGMENKVNPIGLAFLRMRPDLLHNFKAERDVSPTPRSWVEGVFCYTGVISPELEYETYAGAVGEGEAAEYTGFLRVYRELPDVDDCIRNPKTAPVPEGISTRYAMMAALANRASEKNFAAINEYVGRYPGEFSVLCVKMAMARAPEVCHTRAFVDWSVAYQDLVKK